MRVGKSAVRIGADVGGTFTDIIVLNEAGDVLRYKLPSTPPDFEAAVLDGIQRILKGDRDIEGSDVGEVAHGTTVATNAVLEHRGAHTALITTAGFEDILELRRIRVPSLYDIFFDKPRPLVDRYLRIGLKERIGFDGREIVAIEEAELRRVAEILVRENIESVAVCLLHSYAFPAHEEIVGEYLRTNLPDLQISLSCDVLREIREYERTATTVVNAYVSPVMRRYLGALRTGLHGQGIDAPLLIMQSAGSLTTDRDAASRPVYVLESGPTAGVFAARVVAKKAGFSNIISLDMGGTTAKASLVENGRMGYCPEYEVGSTLSTLGNRMVSGAGELIRAPSIDIAEVGAGGGSIAYLDRAGGLHVGPRSAGACPGPVCYQRGGTEATVTDANVVLGFIRAGELADGTVSIDKEAACRAVTDGIAGPLSMDLHEAALGVHRIANARMMSALRAVSTERGRDPREFALVAFGGSGPVHAANLAYELRTSHILVPPLPGLFSAVGLLCSSIEHHEVRTCMLAGEALTVAHLNALREEMRSKLLDLFGSEGCARDRIEFHTSFDMRFKGQTSEIRIPLRQEAALTEEDLRRLEEDFGQEHETLYGHRSDPDNPLEVMAVRVIGSAGTGEDAAIRLATERYEIPQPSREVYFGKDIGLIETPVFGRHQLHERVAGPALVDEYDSTVVIPPGMRAGLDEHENILLEFTNG